MHESGELEDLGGFGMHESDGFPGGCADLMKFCDDNPNCGIGYTIAETTSQFTFANSESTKCQQKLVICMYDREYAVQSTEF
eukprot:s8045_g2.t1